MSRFPQKGLGSFLTVGLVAFLVGCNSGNEMDGGATPSAETQTALDPSEVNTELQGKLNIDGSSTVYPISEAAASAFREKYPNVNIPVGQSGSGNGFKRFVKGEIEISDASRPIKSEEFEVAKEYGIDFVEVPIAYDGLTVVVHKENSFVDNLTVDEIKKIYTTEGNAQTWAEVRAGWPETTIELFAPGTDSGTFDYFKEVVAKDGAIRSDISTSEDDNVLVTGVSGSPNAIGFFGVAYYEENKERLKAVPIVNPGTNAPVFPTPEAIETGEYSPFSRPLFIYVATSKLSRPDVKRFVEFYLDNAGRLAEETAYVALPTEVYDRAKEHVKKRASGTHYLTADGKKREGSIVDIYIPENRLGF